MEPLKETVTSDKITLRSLRSLEALGCMVLVQWHDIVAGDTDWVTKKELVKAMDKPHSIQSAGFVTQVNKKYIIISSMKDMDGDEVRYGMHQTIPLGNINSITEMNPGN
jgi:hypothetical protein